VRDSQSPPAVTMTETQARHRRATPTLSGVAGPISLRVCFWSFFSHASPRVIAVVFLATVACLAGYASWSWWDLLIPAIVFTVEPFTEWIIHVGLLHFRPRTIQGVRLDPLVARKHRAHHANPKDVSLIFIPMPALVFLIGGLAATFLLTTALSYALSGLSAAYAMALTYEWTHFLIHSPYRPRHRLYRYVWRAHRNHHFRNEHYWFGVTMHLADHVLGTFPDVTAVELSPTARTLGADG